MADHQHPHTHSFKANTAEGRFKFFFFEYWPIAVFVFLFLLMCGLPLTLSGMMHNPFSSADSVWAGYGLLLFAEFFIAVAIFCLAPQFLGPYMLLLAIYGLVFAEHGKAWTIGWVSDGSHTWMINNAAILFLTYVLIGNIVFMRANCRSQKENRSI